MSDNTQNLEKTAEQGGQVDAFVSPAIYTAMWPNQPVNVCEKHAQQITNVVATIGLQVPLRPYVGDTADECIICKYEAKQG
jgi:hypothetical protein